MIDDEKRENMPSLDHFMVGGVDPLRNSMIDDEKRKKLEPGSDEEWAGLTGRPFIPKPRDPLLQAYDKIDAKWRRDESFSETVAHAKALTSEMHRLLALLPTSVVAAGESICLDYQLPMFLVTLSVEGSDLAFEATHNEVPLTDKSVLDIVAALLAAKGETSA